MRLLVIIKDLRYKECTAKLNIFSYVIFKVNMTRTFATLPQLHACPVLYDFRVAEV